MARVNNSLNKEEVMKKEAQELFDLLCDHKMEFNNEENNSFDNWCIGSAKNEQDYNDSLADIKLKIDKPQTLLLIDKRRLDILQEVYEEMKFFGCKIYNKDTIGRLLFFFRIK